jgi:hypothetical protein
VIQKFTEEIFPLIGDVSQQQGAFGGARQGILESQAARDLNVILGDIAGELSFRGYEQALQVFQSTLANAPNIIKATLIPAATLEAVGALQQAQEQAEIMGDRERFEFEQNVVFDQAMKLAQANSLLSFGGGGGGGVGGGGLTEEGSRAQGALAGAATGAGIASSIGGTAAFTGPWGWVAMGIGALIGASG